jgi:hypothetical protein
VLKEPLAVFGVVPAIGYDNPVQSLKWALGYLRGRVKGYRKGHLPLASVSTAVQMAQDSKVPTADILALLQAAGLAYDFKTPKAVDER